MTIGLYELPVQWPVLAHVLARILGVVAVAPCLGATMVPVRVRIVFGMMVAGVISPLYVSPAVASEPGLSWCKTPGKKPRRNAIAD